jgi:hypothetical protein
MKKLVINKSLFNPLSLVFLTYSLLMATTANAQQYKLSSNNDELKVLEGKNMNYINEIDKITKQFPEAEFSYNFANGKLKDVTVTGIDDIMTRQHLEVVLFNLKNNKLKNESDQLGVFYTVDKEPHYKGGEDALENTIQNNLTYPKDALDWGASGTIYVKFVVDENGKIPYITTSDMVNTHNKTYKKELEQHAIQAVEATSGKWTPAQEDGVNVASLAVVPIKFKEELAPGLSDWVE